MAGAVPEVGSLSTSDLRITLETLNTSPYSNYTRVLESSTPSLRKSACKVSPAERQFAFDTACQCVEEMLASKGPYMHHARYFRAEGFKVLKEALQPNLLDESFQTSTSGASHEEDTAESSPNDAQLRDTASSLDIARGKKLGIWTKIKRRLSTESPGRAGTSESPQKFAYDKASPKPLGAGKHQPGPSQDEKEFSFVSINVERSLSLLVAAAPGRGEVQHWVWLIRAYINMCSIESVHIMLGYLAKVVKYIAPEEEWLRLLVLELTPVLAVMRNNDLPAKTKVVLRAVADRAMQVADDTILNYRAHRSSRLENAQLLAAAVKLQILVAKCASGAACADMGGLFEELLASAAQQRFRSLLVKCTAEAGVASPTADAKATNERTVVSMASVCDQLVLDIANDEECYQTAFPAECRIRLPAISCRVYCHLLRLELTILAQRNTLETNQGFFSLFQGARQLEQQALKWAPGSLGGAQSFCDVEGRLLFLHHIDGWMRSARSKLMQWSMRLLKEEVWQHAAAGSCAGLRCSPSLVELFRALCAVAEDHAFVSAAHPLYAGLMERTLSKVVLVHVAGLERLCQGEMPSRSGHRLSGQLRSIGSRNETPKGPFQPSSTLCMLLNDLREIRSKQADLSNAVRGRLPAEWWGRSAEEGLKEKMRLGDRFKLCQVEIERRYAAVLHHTVKRMMEGAMPLLAKLLMPQMPEDVSLSMQAEPLKRCLDEHLLRLAPLLDVRVLRRVARELWNTLAGVLHEDLVNCQEGQGGSTHHSLGNVGPRIQHVDAVLKLLSDYIIAHRCAGLSPGDEPDKVTKLRRMLALFMREDDGGSLDSL